MVNYFNSTNRKEYYVLAEEKSLDGIADRIQNAPESERLETAKTLSVLAKELLFQHKFTDAQIAIKEAIQLFKKLSDNKKFLAGAYATLEDAYSGDVNLMTQNKHTKQQSASFKRA